MIARRLLLFAAMLWISFSCLATEYIESFHSDIEVRRTGDLYVTETIRVQAEGKSIRRGIYRDFPTRYRNPQGRDMVVGFELLSVKRDGVSEPFRIKNQSNGKRIYIGDSNVFLTPGIYEYELSYLTTRQLGFYDDFDELYWNVTGNGWAFEIDRASAKVTLPDAVTDFRLTGYTGPQGATEQDLQFRRSGNNQVYFETEQPLARYQGLTIVVGWPGGLIDAPSGAQQRAWFIEDNKAALVLASGALALLIYYLLLWRWFGRDPETGVIVPLYQPPQGYSPASMRFIQNMGYDEKCFTSAIINLAVKGKLEINDDDGDFKVIKTNTSNSSLAAGEAQVLRGLFADGRGNIGIVQSNHSILSSTIREHKNSLKRDYKKKYFNTNSWLLVPGILATMALVVTAILSLPSEEVIMKTVFFSVFSTIPLLMVSAIWRGVKLGGKRGIIQIVSNILVLIAISVVLFMNSMRLLELIEGVPLPLVAGLLAMLALHLLFYQWLKAPTLAGRRLLDKIEGFKHYLQVAEQDEIALAQAPKFTADLYESYLPYAIALDLENEWTARLDRAITQGLVDRQYSQPRWYHCRGHSRHHFSTTLSSSFSSAIASSSVAPGSSSGSSGGSSGGGGGGGGGGGW